MPPTCEWCREAIAFLDAQTSSGKSAWHTRCWNQASEEQAALRAGYDDGEGFACREVPTQRMEEALKQIAREQARRPAQGTGVQGEIFPEVA